MMRFLVVGARFVLLPVLFLLGASTGGLDGIVGGFVLVWMLWRGGPAMWRDVKNACRWFFGMGSRYSLRSLFRGREARGGGLNV